jgi:osmotically inducible protein OsmC
MAIRKAHAEWKGGLRDGAGEIALESGAFRGPYSFKSRFESGGGTNPEELIGAAHAGCFSMALTAGLQQAGHTPTRIATDAAVKLEQVGAGFQITRIDLTTEGTVPGIDAATFDKFAAEAKAGCPVSKALAGVEIHLTAKLV